MAIQVEIWANRIRELYFKNNDFLNTLDREDSYANVTGKVHVPQERWLPNVVKNRSTLPATVRKNSDNDVELSISEYTTDPELIKDAEKKELSYSKLDSVIRRHFSTIIKSSAEDIVYGMAGTTNTDYHLSSTGALESSKRKFLRDDLKRAAALLDRADIPSEMRVALIPSDVIPELFPDDNVTALHLQVASPEERSKGWIGTYAGFRLMKRSSVVRFDTGGSLKAAGALPASGDTDGIVFYYGGAVLASISGVELFDDMGKPEYYGDIYSALLRSGAVNQLADVSGNTLGVGYIKRGT